MAPRKRKTGGHGGSRKKRRVKADYEGESIPARAPGPSYTEAGRPQRTTRAMLNVNHPHFNPNFTHEFRDDPDRRSPTPSPPPLPSRSPSLPSPVIRPAPPTVQQPRPSPPAIPHESENEDEEVEHPVQAPPPSLAQPRTPEQPGVRNTPGAPGPGDGFSSSSGGSHPDTSTPLPGQERRPSVPYPRPPVTPDQPIVRSGQPVATDQQGVGVEDRPENSPRPRADNNDDPFVEDGPARVPAPHPVGSQTGSDNQAPENTPAVSSSPIDPTTTNLVPANFSPDRSPSSSSSGSPSVANLSHANFSPAVYSPPIGFPSFGPLGHLPPGRLSNPSVHPPQTPGNRDLRQSNRPSAEIAQIQTTQRRLRIIEGMPPHLMRAVAMERLGEIETLFRADLPTTARQLLEAERVLLQKLALLGGEDVARLREASGELRSREGENELLAMLRGGGHGRHDDGASRPVEGETDAEEDKESREGSSSSDSTGHSPNGESGSDDEDPRGGGGGTNGAGAGSSSGAASGSGARTDFTNDESGRDDDGQEPSGGNSSDLPPDDADTDNDVELTPSEAAREEEREGRREWWFRHMAACSEARRAGIIIRRARRLHALPMPASHHELVLRADMYRMMREAVEEFVPEDLRPRVWRILNNDEPGDDESRASSHYEGEYEDWDAQEKTKENQRSEEEEEEDVEMTEPDDQRDNSSSSGDDDDNTPGASGATGGTNGHGNGRSGHDQSRPSSRDGGANAPSHTPSTGSPRTTGNRTLESSRDPTQPHPDLNRLLPETRRRLEVIQRMSPEQMREAVMAWGDDLRTMPPPTSEEDARQRQLARQVLEHQGREAERLVSIREELGVDGHMRDGEARARLDAMTDLQEAARDSFRSILHFPRTEVRFDAIVGRIRTLRQLPPFPEDVDPNEDPAVQELNVLRRMIPDILPDGLAAEAMEIVNEEDGPGSADPRVRGDIEFRASDRDLGPVLTDEDIQRNERQRIRFLLSLPTVEEREANILRRAREVRGRFVRQQELRGRFPEAALNDEWRRWLREWHVWNDDTSTLVPGSDLWFRVDRILTGADGELDQEIIAERRNDEASDIIICLEQSLPDYAFLDDELPVRLAELFRAIIVSRTADARARFLINRAFEIRRMETPPRDDPRGLEMTLLRRMAPWLLPPRLLDIVMPVLRGEVEERDAPDMSPISDDETNRLRPAEAPEVVEVDDTELDNNNTAPDQPIQHQPVAPVPDMGEHQASQPPPVHLSSNAATVTTTTTTTTTATASTTHSRTYRDPAEIAAAALGIDLNGPRPTPPVVDPMPEYDHFDQLGLDPEPFYDGDEEWSDDEDEEDPPAPEPAPRFPLSAAARQQRLDRALEEYRSGEEEDSGEEGEEEGDDDGTGGIE